MKILKQVPEKLWRETAEACDYATFFHTPAWAKTLHKTYGKTCKPATKAFSFDDKNWIVLPLMEIEHECKGFFKELYATVPGVYGGCISPTLMEGNHLDEIVERLKSFQIKRIKIFGNPYLEEQRTQLPKLYQFENFTQVIDLAPLKSEEELKNIYSDSVWRRIKQGMQENFEIKQAETMTEVYQFYQVYKQCLARWADRATNDYPAALFENLFNLQSDQAVLWVAKKDGQVVGGNISFYFNGKCHDWHHSCLSEYFKFGLSHLITHRLISDAMKRGCKIYDFNPSGGHRGTADFKASFGAVKKFFHSYETAHPSKLYALYLKLRAPKQNSPVHPA